MKLKSIAQSSLVLGSLLATVALTGCDSGGSAGGSAAPASTSNLTSTSSGSTSSNPSSTPSTGSASPAQPATVGESCVSGDSNHLCLAIHFVAYKDSAGNPTASKDQVATIVHEMNSLWAQCNIGFQVENYETVDPTASGLAYDSAAQSQTDQIRKTYNTIDNMLLAVTTGPWGTAVNAWTAMPGEGTYGAVMEQSIVTYGNGIIYAHEFGHYLGLDHVSDTSDLMNPVIYTTSTTLTASQCQTARDAANSYWSHMLRS